MRLYKLVGGSVAAAAVALAASPAVASAELSLKRAEREAIRVVAPLQVEGAFCFRTEPIARKTRTDKAFCVVSTAAAAGQECTSLVFVRKVPGLRGARAIKAQPIGINRCFPKPPPLGSPDSL